MDKGRKDEIETLAAAWTVNTVELAARVSAAIGESANPPLDTSELLLELRAIRQEIGDLRRTTIQLQDEIGRLRLDVTRRTLTRIAPFSPSEGLVRLS